MHQTPSPFPYLPSLRATALVCAATLVGASACAMSMSPEGDLEPRIASDVPHEVETLIAMVEEASQQWRRACPEPGAYGLCVRFDVARADPNQCDRPVLDQVVVRTRDPEAANGAQKMFEHTIEAAEHLEDPQDPELLAAYRHALGQARIALADADLETCFEITMPSSLDFSTDPTKRSEGAAQLQKTQASREAFAAYFNAKVSSSASLITDLARVKETADPQSIVQAALRTSWISGHFADQLRSATVPESLRELPAARAAYCDALSDQTDEPIRMALEAATYCREQADQLGYTGPEVDACGDVIAAFSTQRSSASGD
jgi:hypothetical protein